MAIMGIVQSLQSWLIGEIIGITAMIMQRKNHSPSYNHSNPSPDIG